MRRQSATLLTVLFFGVSLYLFFFREPTPHARPPASDRGRCLLNVKQLGVAIKRWTEQHGRFPESFEETVEGIPVSWRVTLLPFLLPDDVYSGYDRQSTWDSEQNLHVAKLRIDTLSCPSFHSPTDPLGRVHTSFALLHGHRTIVRAPRSLAPKEVSDGMANTILAAEACGLGIVWTQPRDIDSDLLQAGVVALTDSQTAADAWFSSYHKGGAYVLMADGTVRFLSVATSKSVLRAFMTASGGD